MHSFITINHQAAIKYTRTIIVSSIMVFLASCTSSTQLGETGIDRKQLLLGSSQQINAMAEKQYAQTVAQARRSRKLDRNKRQVRRLQRIADRIIAQVSIFRSDAHMWNWEVHTIKSNKINAYVAPGGKIMFYTGIIDTLSLTDDEIAAIMGHEVSHALREHARESFSRKMTTQMGFGILAKNLGLSKSQTQMAGMVNQYGFSLPHNRVQESEADVLGIELAARAGYNPQAAVTLWEKMRNHNGSGVPAFMSTHPSSTSRIKKLRSLVPKVMHLYNNAQGMNVKKTKKSSRKKSKSRNYKPTYKFKSFKGQ